MADSLTVMPEAKEAPKTPEPIGEPDGNGGIVVRQTERPSWLPEKFSTPEELAKSYAELESKLGAPKQDAPKSEEPKAAESKLDMAALSNEFTEKGDLSPETRKALEEKGFTPEMVDTYIAGQKAKAGELRRGLAEAFGGEEQMAAAFEWAKQGLPPEELAAYQSALKTSPDVAKVALRGLAAQYAAASGPNLVRPGETGSLNTGTKPFRSQAEVMEAMSNPKYGRDPAYRKDVIDRLAVSSVF